MGRILYRRFLVISQNSESATPPPPQRFPKILTPKIHRFLVVAFALSPGGAIRIKILTSLALHWKERISVLVTGRTDPVPWFASGTTYNRVDIWSISPSYIVCPFTQLYVYRSGRTRLFDFPSAFYAQSYSIYKARFFDNTVDAPASKCSSNSGMVLFKLSKEPLLHPCAST